jgi:hypothetical protein
VRPVHGPEEVQRAPATLLQEVGFQARKAVYEVPHYVRFFFFFSAQSDAPASSPLRAAAPSAREFLTPAAPLTCRRPLQVKKCEETKFKSELLKAGVFY